MKWKLQLRQVAVAATGAVLATGGVAHAATAKLDFGLAAPTPGTISFAGTTSDPLTGTNIQVDNVVGLNTPLHLAQKSTCVSCLLNFSSGDFTGYNAATKTWTFNGGGAISIIGGIDFTDNTSIPDIATGSTLLSGTFTAASVTKLPTGFYDFRIAAGSFDDTKNSVLLSYYGLPEVSYKGSMNLSFSATPNGTYGFTSTAVRSGDIINAPVPLPAAAWLLASGLIGLAGRRRAA